MHCKYCSKKLLILSWKVCQNCENKTLGKRIKRWAKKNGINLAKYNYAHLWIKKKLGSPSKCENCNKIENSNFRIHWANRSGKYLKDVVDWIRLCIECHRKFDKR